MKLYSMFRTFIVSHWKNIGTHTCYGLIPQIRMIMVLFANVQGNISLLSFGEKHFLKMLAKKLEAFTKNYFYKTIDIHAKLLRSHST